MGDKVERVKHNVTVDDIPGDGMAKKAGEALRDRNKRNKQMMDELFGGGKKKKSKK